MLDESVDLVNLTVYFVPKIREVIPLSVELVEGFPLLFDPGEVFEIMNLTLVVMTEFMHVGNGLSCEIAVVVLHRPDFRIRAVGFPQSIESRLV